ncbi:MAG: DUF3048 domain-containing protein [Lachnospiraceae bacterium]|nr:DUF3048 domain-containing protein [Lachnospiraceae bacterium]
MKKRSMTIAALGLACAMFAAACGTETEPGGDSETVHELIPADDGIGIAQGVGEGSGSQEEVPEEEEDVIPEGMYRSELTNEFISLDLQDQRPIAVMVDNEITALPHFGTSQADIVYEMVNSTLNGRITRLMCIVKDWGNLEQFGSVRSTRPTNVMIAGEYNAILCHDGGPYYINTFLSRDYSNNISGYFARFPNGKSREYTEYVTSDGYTNPQTGDYYRGLNELVDFLGYSATYNEHKQEPHFQFSRKDIKLSDEHSDAFKAVDVKLPFPHNSSELHYNADTGLYEYWEYGQKYVDAGNNDAPLAFKNVILQKCNFTQLDEHGYLVYNIMVADPWDGYLLQGGEAIPIKWVKYGQENIPTVFMNMDDSFITLNTGKTYIAIVPDDAWSEVELK